MRIALGLLLVAGCASDPGPHDVVKCSTGFGQCELACNQIVRTRVGSGCVASHDGNDRVCDTEFSYQGTIGCCAPPPAAEMSDVSVVFYECP